MPQFSSYDIEYLYNTFQTDKTRIISTNLLLLHLVCNILLYHLELEFNFQIYWPQSFNLLCGRRKFGSQL